MANITDTLLETIEYAIDNKLERAQFDRTIVCTVTNIKNNTLTLSHGAESYQVNVKNNTGINLYDKVHLRFPANNTVAKYIEEDLMTAGGGGGGGGGVGNVISVNGKTGVVTIEITDIPGLSEALSQHSSGQQIIKNATMPSTQTVNDIWYEIIEG